MNHTITGCTLAQYAEAKQLPLDFLKTLGSKDTNYYGVQCIRFPYFNAQGLEQAVRFRIAMQGKKRFVWEKGSKTTLYLNPKMNASYSYCVLVEGESDCHTLWYHNIAAYGVAGGANWKEEDAALLELEKYDDIYVIIEDDSGGKDLEKSLSKSKIRHKLKLIRLEGFKDPSEMHCDAPDKFLERWQQAIDSATVFEPLQPEESPDCSPFDALMQSAEQLCKGDHEAATALLEEASSLPVLQRRRLLDVIKERTGFGIGELRKAMGEIHGTEGHDHLNLAREVLQDIGSDNLLSTAAHVWQWYESGVWKIIDERKVKQLVQHVLEQQGHDVMRGLVDAVADVLKTAIYALEHEWNRCGDVISFQNGELHWNGNGWELKPHDREHYCTTQIPYHYDTSAQCPRFMLFLDEIFGGDSDGKDKAKLVMQLIGYTLVSHARYEVFVLLIGGGANGKSVLLDIIRMMVGRDNVSAVQPSQFSNRFQRAHLHGKLANLVTEIAEGAEIADAELKAIVSGELTTAEHKNKDPFSFRPFSTCWFGTNHMPHTRDFSDAFFRRAKVITFNRTFKAGIDADPLLKDKLAEEMAGIINVSIAAFGEVIKRGTFTEPQSCIDAKQAWRIEADPVAQFVGEVCIPDNNSEIASGELYYGYKLWADENGFIRKLNKKNFSTRIGRLGGKLFRTTGGKRMIVGFSLKPLHERE